MAIIAACSYQGKKTGRTLKSFAVKSPSENMVIVDQKSKSQLAMKLQIIASLFGSKPKGKA